MGNKAVHGSLKRQRKKSSDIARDFEKEKNGMVKVVNPDVSAMDFYDVRDGTAGDLMDESRDNGLEHETSQIEEYYKGKTILLTGASGFVGTILLEKLLRTMDIEKVYVLFRGKKAQSLDTRLRDYFAEEIFDQLRKERRHYHKKVVILDADLQSEGLGLNDEEQRVLIDDVQVVFHVAATVKFDELLNIAYRINCFGTEQLLNLAEKMRNLESFVYVSTAYSNCHFKKIEEKFYDPIYTHIEIKQMIDFCSQSELAVLNDMLIKPLPNTYALTKQANEYMCQTKLGAVPLVIVRPSIVMPIVGEPCPMWTKGLNGLTALFVAVGTGAMRTVYQNAEITIDIVPGDIVISCLLAAGWDRGVRYLEEKVKASSGEIIKDKFDRNNNPITDKLKEDIEGRDIRNDHHTVQKSIFHEVKEENEKFVKEDSDEFRVENSMDAANNNFEDTNTAPIFNIVSCVENPVLLGTVTDRVIHAFNTSGEGCDKTLWVIHHNATNKKWLYFFYFYVYNLLPTVLFFVFLEKLAGRKAQLMKIYRKIFFLNTTVAHFSLNEWIFTNENALSLQKRMSPKDRYKYSFSLKPVNWYAYLYHIPRSMARYGLFTHTSKHLYETRTKYIKIADTVILNSVKVLLGYIAYRFACSLLYRYV